MSGFPKKERQRIIDEYLATTGRNMFSAAEFIDWLAEEPDHEAYEWFYGIDDSEAARQYRIDMARRMASGLRIVVQNESPADSKVVHITTREFPAYVSPVAGRKSGGGYSPFNPDDPELMAELQAQAGQSLAAWLNRYRGAVEHAGISLEQVESVIIKLRPSEEKASA